MRTTTLTIMAALLCGSLVDGAMAQQQEVRRGFAIAGTFEVGGSAGFSSSTEVRNGATFDPAYSIALSPTAGYFLIDALEIVVNPLSISYDWSGNRNAFSLLPMAGLAYNFRAHPRAFPYLEGVAGGAYSRSDNGTSTITQSGFAWAARGGVKFLITTTSLVNIGLQYQQVTLDRSNDTQRNGYNLISASVGLTVWL